MYEMREMRNGVRNELGMGIDFKFAFRFIA